MRPIDAENFEVFSWKATDNQDYNDGFNDGVIFVTEKIDNAPTIEVAPVVHGRWIDENPDNSLDPRMRCSICARVESPLIKWRYCPNCGAKMDGANINE